MKKEKGKRNSEKVSTSILFTFSLLLFTCSAAVPLSWTVETSRAQPATFEAYQGETLTFEAALQSHGKPLAAPLNYSIYWQTNGMGSTYWEAPCKSGEAESFPLQNQSTNVLFATWHPSMDVGARVYNCFIGSPSNIYHAAFQLRLRPSPGWTPNALPLPTPVIDFATIRVLNPPWKGGGGGAVQSVNGKTGAVVLDAEAIPYSGNESYGTVTNVEKGLDYAIFTADNAMTEATGRPTYEDLDGYLPLTGGTMNGPLMLPYDEIETMSISMAGPGGEFALTGGGSYHIWQYWPNTDAEGDREIAVKGDIPVVSATDPTFSNEVATVARTVTPQPSPKLRVWDRVRQCWWVGEMVNGVIQWEVE